LFIEKSNIKRQNIFEYMAQLEPKMTLPSAKTLEHCAKLSCSEDKPIMMDYWLDSCTGKVMIGVRDSDDKLLVRSEEEYTSPISKIFKIDNELIIITENSIYVVSASIPKKKISS
jgi:hypothetical protein